MNQQKQPPASWHYGELWDLFDEKRRPLGRTHPRGQPMEPGTYHVVGEVWTVDSKNRLMLTLRSPDKEYYPNLWEVTAGSLTTGEESREGVCRELLEETGIAADPGALRLLGVSSVPGVFVDIYAHRCEAGEIHLQTDETSDSRWVTLDELDRMIAQGRVAPHIIHHLKRVRPQLEFFLSPVVLPGRYRHFGGELYDVLDMATHSETGRPMVVCRSLSDGRLWVRPAELWGEMVPMEGDCVPRFAPVEP